MDRQYGGTLRQCIVGIAIAFIFGSAYVLEMRYSDLHSELKIREAELASIKQKIKDFESKVQNFERRLVYNRISEEKETGNLTKRISRIESWISDVKKTGVGCLPGWNQFHNKCYWFSHTARPWGEAEAICLGFHSKLAEPRTHAESAFLMSHFQSLHARFYWIGISDLIEENRWIYSSDQQPITVNDFHTGEPNQHTRANCAALWDTGRGKWADELCENAYRFVCEAVFDEGGDILG